MQYLGAPVRVTLGAFPGLAAGGVRLEEAASSAARDGATMRRLHVGLAPGVAPERLRALVEAGCRCSPIPNAVERATPVALRIDVDAG